MGNLYLKVDEYKMVEMPKEIPTIEPSPLDDDIYNDAWTLATSGSFSVRMPKSSLYRIYIVSGFKRQVPNNWLKFHGYPMNRR